MYKFFCLDCDSDIDSNELASECPFCRSPNIMEDTGIDDWDGHFEGDMGHDKHDMGDM
jgi:hypothetical protein